MNAAARVANSVANAPLVRGANAAANAASNAAKGANAAANAAAQKTQSGMSKIYEKMKAVVGEKGGVIILIAVVLLAFIAVIVYISFTLKASNLQGKRLLPEPIKLDEQKTPTTIDAGEIPKSAVGREYTFSCWLYVDSFDQTNETPQMIMYRGSKNTIADANPIFMMDGNNNKLYFVLKTQGSSFTNSTDINYDVNLKHILSRSYFNNKDFKIDTPNIHKHIILSVDYIPLQRWVNLVLVVDNKIITTFMDGEIYSVKTVDEYKMTKQPEFDVRGNKIDHNLIIEKSEGSIFLGKYNNGRSPNAFLSNLEYYNYAISLNDVKKIYMNGPFSKNFLNMIGISSYGVRSPIYKIDEYQSNM